MSAASQIVTLLKIAFKLLEKYYSSNVVVCFFSVLPRFASGSNCARVMACRLSISYKKKSVVEIYISISITMYTNSYANQSISLTNFISSGMKNEGMFDLGFM